MPLPAGVTARGAWQWMQVFARLIEGAPGRSPHIEITRARRILVELRRKQPYDLDGGVRPPAKRLEVRVEPAAVSICVPAAGGLG